MHLVAGDAGEFATTKTRRRLYAVEFASRYSNHSIPPESVSEETRLGPANKIFLVTVIGRVWLHDKTLREIVSAGRKPEPWRLKSILSVMLLKAQTLCH